MMTYIFLEATSENGCGNWHFVVWNRFKINRENRAAHPHQEFPTEKSWLFVSIAREWSQDCWKINQANASGYFRIQNAGHLFSQVYSCIVWLSIGISEFLRHILLFQKIWSILVHWNPSVISPFHGHGINIFWNLTFPKQLHGAALVRGISVNYYIHSCVNFLDCSVRWTWKNRAGFGKEQRKAG